MRLISALSVSACLLLLSQATEAATTYYSQGSLDPALTASWNTVRAGGGASPGNFTAGDTFVIQTNHNMGTASAWTVSGAGAKIQIESGGILTANNLVVVPAFQVDNGGAYIHNATGSTSNGSASDVPGSSSRTFGSSSTAEFQKWANGGSGPTPLPSGIIWGNLTINVGTLAGSWNQAGTLTNIAGNLLIEQTGGREFRLAANALSANLNVGGDILVSGGTLTFSSGTASATVNVAGNLQVTGGLLQEATAGGFCSLSVTNAITVNGGTLALSRDLLINPSSFLIDGGALKSCANTVGSLSSGRVVTVGASGGEFGGASSSGALLLSNSITGPGNLIVRSGTVELWGTNTFAGNLTIAGISSTNNPTVRFHSNYGAGTNRIIVSPADPAVTTTLGHTNSTDITVTNEITFNSGGDKILLSSSVGNLIFSGKFSGDGTLFRTTLDSIVTLAGDNSGWSGGFVAQSGLTSLAHPNALGTGPLLIVPFGSGQAMLQAAIPLTGLNAVTNPINYINTNSGTFAFLGTNDLELSGPVTVSGSSAKFNCANTGASILSGPMSGAPGLGLTKFTGGQRLILAGNDTCNGTAAVNAGTLLVNGNLASTNVAVGFSGALRGVGVIAGPVSVASNCSIGAGNSAGILTVTNGLDLSGGGTDVWELAANSADIPGTEFDQIALTGGTLMLGGSSQLLINFIGSATPPDTSTPFWQSPHTWTIIALSGGATNAGNSNFASIAGTNGIAVGTFTASVSGGSVLLTYTPRPRMTLTWNGAGTNAFWTNASNWVGTIAPANGDSLVFPTGAARLTNTNPVGGPTNFASITLSGSNYVIFSPALTLTNGFTNSPPSFRSNRLEVAIALGGDQTWKLIASAATLTMASNVNLGPFHLNLIGIASPTLEVLGNITGSSGSQLFMDGGVIKLSGPANDVPDFKVNSGNLQINNGVLSGGLSIAIGGRLQGTGTVPAFTCDGIFQPGGPAAPGAMTILSGSTVFTSGSDFEADLFGSASPGVNYDQVRVSTPPDLSGATLNVTPFYSATNGETFVIITNTGASAFTTTFPGYPEGSILVFSSPANEFRISYAGGNGNDVTLKRVPLGTASAPRLTIQSATAIAVRLLWPTNPPLFNLESNTNVASTNWVAASPAPVVIGTNNVVTNSIAPGPKFYRLKK